MTIHVEDDCRWAALSVIHYEFIPKKRTVNKEMNFKIICHLRGAMKRMLLEKWAQNIWFFCMTMHQLVCIYLCGLTS
jgi:hypothetical protein